MVAWGRLMAMRLLTWVRLTEPTLTTAGMSNDSGTTSAPRKSTRPSERRPPDGSALGPEGGCAGRGSL